MVVSDILMYGSMEAQSGHMSGINDQNGRSAQNIEVGEVQVQVGFKLKLYVRVVTRHASRMHS